MALTFKLTDIKDYESVVYEPVLDSSGQPKLHEDGTPVLRFSPVTDGLVWATMFVGIPEITKKNYMEFYCRLQMYCSLMGPIVSSRLVPDVWAVWVDRGDTEQYLVASKTVQSAISFCRRHYVESEGGQDDPEFWRKTTEEALEVFEKNRHGDFTVYPEGREGDLVFVLRGSELLSDVQQIDGLTLDAVKAHIGLSTNASPKTAAKFLNGVFRQVKDSVELKVRSEAQTQS